MGENALSSATRQNEPAPELLPDAELESRLMRLAAIERRALAMLLAHLGEFDHRRLYADRGRPSLFAYCTRVLGYSEQAAYKRIQAARAARRHRALLRHLTDGRINLAAIVVLAPHFRPDNIESLVNEACGKSKRELEILAAALDPKPDAPDCLRALPASDDPSRPAAIVDSKEISSAQAVHLPLLADQSRLTRELMDPLSPERHLFRFTGSSALRRKFERARELLNVDRSDGAMEIVFEAGIEALLERRDPELRIKRRKARPRERNSGGTAGAGRCCANSRYITAELRDAVWKRDGGRCTFVESGGDRCPGTMHLEIDHVVPFAMGGKSDDPANLRLMCRAHNQLLARRTFGARDRKPGRIRRDQSNYPRG